MVIDSSEPPSSRGRYIYARLRLKHLQLVDILHRTGNIGRAATELNLTQSAASKILQDAETIFGLPLFTRQSRGLSPTVAGLEVIQYAQLSLNQAAKIIADVDALSSGGAGSLAVGAIMVSTPHILSTALAELRRRKPLLTVHLTTTTSDQIVDMLEKGQIEIGLCRLTHASQGIALEFEELFDETYWVFVSRTHPVARQAVTSVAALVELPWVVQPGTSPSRQVLEAAFAAVGVPMPRARVETTSRFAALHLVKRAGMVGLLPSTLLAEDVARGDLVKLDVGVLRPASRYGLVTRRDEAKSEHVRDFTAIVRAIRDPVGHTD